MRQFNQGTRWRKTGLVAALIVVFWAVAALAGESEPAASQPSGKDTMSHFNLNDDVVAVVLERFAENPKTKSADVRKLMEYDIKAGLWVIRNRSFRGDDLVECADYLASLNRLEDSFAVEVAEVYRTWQAWDPKAFHMATDDPVRNRVLTKMRDLAKGKEAKKTIQRSIDRFDADRDNFNSPPSQLDIDPNLSPHP